MNYHFSRQTNPRDVIRSIHKFAKFCFLYLRITAANLMQMRSSSPGAKQSGR